MRYKILLIALVAAAMPCRPAEPIPVTSAYCLEVGSAHRTDTYLSPLGYSGTGYGFSYDREQPMRFSPGKWTMTLSARLQYSRMLNPVRTARMQDVWIRPQWAMLRNFTPLDGLRVGVGGEVSLNAGVLYLPRNGNNPAQAQVAATVGATAYGQYDLRIGRMPVTLRLQPRIPLLGAFFAPHYDELYYEIWLGNHSGLCRFAWPGSYFRVDNLLSADIHFGATTLRVGYRFDWLSSSASGNISRAASHSFVLGVVVKRISLPIK